MNPFGFLALFALDFVLYVFKGFCLKWLWLWFLVPLGVPAITVPVAVGISIIIGRLTNNTFTEIDDLSEYTIKMLSHTLVGWSFALGVGFIFYAMT